MPPILADTVTAVEDKTFWANTGIDPLGIASAALDTLTGDARGGSTITQQLVRQKLLPDDVMQESTRLGDRKIKELIQSVRVTDAYRGREGKEAILTAYLNQNFYGNNSYGVQAAAKSYFGIADLDDLSLAQAATLAAIPQAPSTYDLVRNAVETDDGRLVVPADSAIVPRRNLILDLLANDPTRRELTGWHLHPRGLPGRQAGGAGDRAAVPGRHGRRRTSCGTSARSCASASAARPRPATSSSRAACAS